MSIEIDVLNGDASWKRTEPLHEAVFGRHIVEKLPWGHIEWANADLRVLIDAPEGGSQATALAAIRNGDIAAIGAVIAGGEPRVVGRSRNTPATTRKVRVAMSKLLREFSASAH